MKKVYYLFLKMSDEILDDTFVDEAGSTTKKQVIIPTILLTPPSGPVYNEQVLLIN